jgi:2-desacetyl-2-hydroxyethyl bacteriochlorophyllide A dehydrogenase
MRDIELQSEQKLHIFEHEIPELKEGELLIKTARCGICGTDVHSYYGETIFGKVFPFHIGHEVCGYVEKVQGSNSTFEVGDLAVINPFFTCNSCPACLMDRSNDCENKTTIGLKGPGGYSEYIIVPETSTLKVKKGFDIDRLTLAEPLADIIYAKEKLEINSNMKVLIVGVGSIGLMFLQLMKGHMFESLAASDFNNNKLEKALKLGADVVYNPQNNDVITEKYEIIIDCTGSAASVKQDINYLAFGGQLLSFGVCKSDAKIEISPFDLYKLDAKFISSFALNKSSMQKSLAILYSSSFDSDTVIDSVRPVSELEECLKEIHDGKVDGKIVIDTTKF